MNWYKKIIARNPRYPGQLEGDEFRPDDAVFTDIIQDNEIVEGEYVAILHRMAQEQDWAGFDTYTKRLLQEGHNQNRVDSMVRRAMHGVKL